MWQKVAKFKGAEYFRKALYIVQCAPRDTVFYSRMGLLRLSFNDFSKYFFKFNRKKLWQLPVTHMNSEVFYSLVCANSYVVQSGIVYQHCSEERVIIPIHYVSFFYWERYAIHTTSLIKCLFLAWIEVIKFRLTRSMWTASTTVASYKFGINNNNNWGMWSSFYYSQGQSDSVNSLLQYSTVSNVCHYYLDHFQSINSWQYH